VKSVDKEVTDAWVNQRFQDLKYLSAQYKEDSNQQFADRLFNFYSEKYYWRDWVVIVYNKMAKSRTGTKGHDFDLCGGDEYLEKDGRNVLTSSVAKDKLKRNTEYIANELSRVRTETVAWIHYPWKATSVMNQVRNIGNSSTVCMRAVISDHKKPRSKSAPGRLADKNKYFYNMYIFQ
jgi:hypothetical protein